MALREYKVRFLPYKWRFLALLDMLRYERGNCLVKEVAETSDKKVEVTLIFKKEPSQRWISFGFKLEEV